ncbi:MAG: response regulator [Lachnospiraceae bacterium]|nr:response regulator [Lachnospiraceae bacterium]
MKTLLLVEDEKLIRRGIKAMIQRSGVPVDNILECGNGEMALEILKMQKVDVMFTDIRMPKMDGIALVKAMQELPNVPLTVAVSGYDDFTYAVEMMRMGVREYILKPVDRDKVREVLEKLNEEVTRGRESERKGRSLSCQQLKYAILNDNLTESEKSLLARQYEDTFFAGEYLVILTSSTGDLEDNVLENCPFIHLDAVDGNDLFITDESYLPILLKDELAGRCVGISSPHTGIESLKKACKEALSARKEAFYLGKESLSYGEMAGKTNADTLREQAYSRENSLRIEDSAVEQIVHQLGTDKYEDALRQIKRIFQNAALGGYTPEQMEDGMEKLLDGILTTYANILKTEKEAVREYYAIYGFNLFSEYESEVLGWLTNFCDTLNSRFDDYKNKQKIQQAVSYIKENYDKDLNMAVVSNHISMNYSLFSYVFKQYTGNNFVNYLKEIRIQEAKRLLEETDMKVVDISGRVGYENEKHFMKTFKASCGVSPTEYRKNMQFKGKD